MDRGLDSAMQKLFAPRKTPQQYMLVAVSSEDADVRRDAVTQIARSKQANADWAIQGYVAIALLESEAQTRCVAIRALARAADPRATEVMLKILNYTDHPAQEVWPPVDIVRWDATAALADLSASGAVLADRRDAAARTFRDRLKLDSDRHARLAAARGLGYYPTDENVRALIEGLRDQDFAVAHECENALVRLTGRTHGGNPLAWEEWRAANTDALFAHAGEIPDSRRPPYTNDWEKAAYETRDTLHWLWPGSKDE